MPESRDDHALTHTCYGYTFHHIYEIDLDFFIGTIYTKHAKAANDYLWASSRRFDTDHNVCIHGCIRLQCVGRT